MGWRKIVGKLFNRGFRGPYSEWAPHSLRGNGQIASNANLEGRWRSLRVSLAAIGGGAGRPLSLGPRRGGKRGATDSKEGGAPGVGEASQINQELCSGMVILESLDVWKASLSHEGIESLKKKRRTKPDQSYQENLYPMGDTMREQTEALPALTSCPDRRRENRRSKPKHPYRRSRYTV